MNQYRCTIRSLVAFLALIAGIIAASAVAFAYDNSVTGKWKMTSISPDGNEVLWTLTITNKDGKYDGTMGGDEGEAPVKDLKVNGDKLSLTVPYHDGEYLIQLTLKDDKLTGTWSGDGESGDTKGERAAK